MEKKKFFLFAFFSGPTSICIAIDMCGKRSKLLVKYVARVFTVHPVVGVV